MMRRRRPLLRGAMVGGAGYLAGKSAANRAVREQSQEERLSSVEGQQVAPAPPPSAPTGATVAEQLKQLAELRDTGVLTPEEFEREKRKLLAAGGSGDERWHGEGRIGIGPPHRVSGPRHPIRR